MIELRACSVAGAPKCSPFSRLVNWLGDIPYECDALLKTNNVFQVEWVRSCSEALERLDGIAAILVDLDLPDSRGIDTFDRLFRAAPRIPILI
jgi:CheY-like chemotaxis protein